MQPFGLRRSSTDETRSLSNPGPTESAGPERSTKVSRFVLWTAGALACALVGFGSVALADSAAAAAAQGPAMTSAAYPSGSCGQIEVVNNQPSGSGDASVATDCFAKAFASCATTSLQVGWQAGITRTFLTAPGNNGCTIADVVDYGGGKGGDTYLCTDLRTTADGLIAARCGSDGDVMIPSKNARVVSAPSS